MSVFPRQDVGGALARARMYGHACGGAPIRGAGAGARRDVSGIDAQHDATDPRDQGAATVAAHARSHDEENMTTTNEPSHFFEEGWNRHDVDRLMTFMADDCVFESTAGAEACGTRHAGRERVREAFARVFAAFPDARFDEARHFVAGERGVSGWGVRGAPAAGTQPRVDGRAPLPIAGGQSTPKSLYFTTRA